MLRLISHILAWLFFAFTAGFSQRLPEIDYLYGNNDKEKPASTGKRVSKAGERAVNTSKQKTWKASSQASAGNTINQLQDTGISRRLEAPPGYKMAEYTLREVNFLSDDMVLKGINPSYDLYIPLYRNLKKARISLKILLPEYLRKDSSVSILVNDIPRYSISLQDSGKPVDIDISPERGKDFAKVSIRGNLRLSNNVCEDAFSDRPYLIISADSRLSFVYRPAEDIDTFLMDYGRHFCIQDKALLPFVYYLSKVRSIPPVFEWGIKESCEKVIIPSTAETKLEGNVLYMSDKTLRALQEGYRSFIFGKSLYVQQVTDRKKHHYDAISLRDLSIRTSTIRGMSNLSFYIPFNTAIFGGMPDTLFLVLNFSHTPAHQKDKMELRVYLNDALIESIPLEGHGRRSLNIKVPTQELSYGHNSLVVNLVNFTSSDNCFGALTQSAFTIFDNSYFYWNSVSREVSTIGDFLRIMNGNVGLSIEDSNMMPLIVNLLNNLAQVNKSIEKIELVNDVNLKDYDFLLSFGKKNSGAELFEVYDPTDKKVIFSAKYFTPFVFLSLNINKIPELVFQSYGRPDFELLSSSYDIKDYMNLYGNLAVISDNYFASFDTLQKLRLRYEGQKSISYYWNKYRLIFVLLLAVPVLYLLVYTYRRLTRRAI